MVLGAGRGPLVRASLNAAELANRLIKVYAVEKNPNAIVTYVFWQFLPLHIHPEVSLLPTWNLPIIFWRHWSLTLNQAKSFAASSPIWLNNLNKEWQRKIGLRMDPVGDDFSRNWQVDVLKQIPLSLHCYKLASMDVFRQLNWTWSSFFGLEEILTLKLPNHIFRFGVL